MKTKFSFTLILLVLNCQLALAEATKLVVAYASPAATFCHGWIARREGIFAKYNLDVEMVLMQGASTYMPALASGNIQVLYGGGTAVSRAIATGGFDLAVIATETRYVPLRMMVNARVLFIEIVGQSVLIQLSHKGRSEESSGLKDFPLGSAGKIDLSPSMERYCCFIAPP
jgi:hypothetical protein